MTSRNHTLKLCAILVCAAALTAAVPLRAATITVTSTIDCSGAGCDAGNATLRMAIESVNAGADVENVVADTTQPYGTNDTIQFSYASYPRTLTPDGALPAITKAVNIVGPGAANLTISGSDLYRVFFINTAAVCVPVEISDLTIAHGHAKGGKGADSVFNGAGGGGAGLGGGVLVNGGAVSLKNIVFDSNAVAGGEGGSLLASGISLPGGGGGVDGNDASGPVGGNGGIFGGTGGGTNTNSCADGGNGTPDGAGGGGGLLLASKGGAGSFGGGGGGSLDGVVGSCTASAGLGGAFGGNGGKASSGSGGWGAGGAIFVRQGARLDLAGCTFNSNSAAKGSGGSGAADGEGKGGAIYVMDGASATACSSSGFSGNSATDQPGTATDNNDVFGTLTAASSPSISCPSDVTVANDPGVCSASVDPGTATTDTACASITGVRSDSEALDASYPVGQTTITWTATDLCGGTSQCTQTITVNDTEKPVVTSSVSVGVLTNDHTMKNVGYSESATDNCSGSLTGSVVIQIYSSEQEQAPTSTGGDGTTSPDARGRGTCYNSGTWLNQIALRQERLNNGPGRIYLIKTSATDGSGNIGWSCATVVSPRSSKKADLNKVLSAATAVRNVCNQFGAIPSNYYPIGCGPVIGSKQ